ncbi:low molecular weight protein-tyrosine-phosphatase [Robiginitomaculum antarcticum]|uniref:low molecular weight protein-tyrosine-phosphatase n=1 Tax=Robiginitomaculum antarcticum TaxID=437507 RepID=UPI0003748F07|nr:low molecular weight protein-tyrosine-phosphatase [Robiginitomaculum antarcticum]
MRQDHKPSVLFVCLGNICRSPTAEAVFRARAKAAGLDVEIDSAGTGAWHAGEPPDARAMDAGERRGYDFTGQSARAVEGLDFARFDYVLAMDSENLAHLNAMKPVTYSGHLGLFCDFSGAQDTGRDVPDPYYGGPQGFETVLDMIERASDGLIAKIRS